MCEERDKDDPQESCFSRPQVPEQSLLCAFSWRMQESSLTVATSSRGQLKKGLSNSLMCVLDPVGPCQEDFPRTCLWQPGGGRTLPFCSFGEGVPPQPNISLAPTFLAVCSCGNLVPDSIFLPGCLHTAHRNKCGRSQADCSSPSFTMVLGNCVASLCTPMHNLFSQGFTLGKSRQESNWQGLILQTRLARKSLYSSNWPRTHDNPPALTLQVLRLRVYITMLVFKLAGFLFICSCLFVRQGLTMYPQLDLTELSLYLPPMCQN